MAAAPLGKTSRLSLPDHRNIDKWLRRKVLIDRVLFMQADKVKALVKNPCDMFFSRYVTSTDLFLYCRNARECFGLGVRKNETSHLRNSSFGWYYGTTFHARCLTLPEPTDMEASSIMVCCTTLKFMKGIYIYKTESVPPIWPLYYALPGFPRICPAAKYLQHLQKLTLYPCAPI
jgi:hypothetical protein